MLLSCVKELTLTPSSTWLWVPVQEEMVLGMQARFVD
jgi:hypothetical protein